VVYGFVLIVLVVLVTRKLGYEWTAGEGELRGAMLLFVGAMVATGIIPIVSDVDFSRNLATLAGIASGVGWLLVVRAAFAIGKKPAA
jgi:hypothetical protein